MPFCACMSLCLCASEEQAFRTSAVIFKKIEKTKPVTLSQWGGRMANGERFLLLL